VVVFAHEPPEEGAIILGFEEDPGATLSDALEPDLGLGRNRNFLQGLFSFTASDVTSFLTTVSSSGKNFTKASLTGGYLRMNGTAQFVNTNLSSNGYIAYAGACYNYNGYWYTDDNMLIGCNLNEYASGSSPASNFQSGTTYYGYVESASGLSISGTFHLYNATW